MERNNKRPIVGITQGDGNGIGYEVIIKSLTDTRILESFTPVIYGSSKIFGFYRKLIHNLDQMDTYVIQSAKEKLARGRTREYLSSMAQLGYSRQQVKALLDTWEEE